MSVVLCLEHPTGVTTMLRRSLFGVVGAIALTYASLTSAATNTQRDTSRESYLPLYQNFVQTQTQPVSLPPGGREATIKRWNQIAIDATGLDHTPVAPGENRVFGEQLGPARASRAMAIIHIAMFDAANGVTRQYRSYSPLIAAPPQTSFEVAVATAAHDTLVAMFPSQRATFDHELARDIVNGHAPLPALLGVAYGRTAALAILIRRHNDGSNHAEQFMGVDYLPGDAAGIWRQDPITLIPIALGSKWAQVKPFVIPNASAFRIPPPPPMTSPEYATAYNEVKQLGGDGITTPTLRNADQAHIGIFWAYDGTPSLCAPPRLYNQVASQIADQRGTAYMQRLRLLALINVAMADTGIAAWESKFHYAFWRPITGIREADEGWGPTGSGDGNPATVVDETWTPLGAPASNTTSLNFTPPFPAYPSGHAAFGGALFEVLRRFYGTDDVAFTFVSDEFNGVTTGNDGNVRPYLPRSYTTLTDAEEENGQSRIYLGIHWSFDKTEGITQGNEVADYVYDRVFQPR
jgi:hypothetical protein